MDNNYGSYNNDPNYQRPRKRVSRDTLRKRQLCALAVIALIVLIFVIIVANACTKKSSKSDGKNSTTEAVTTTTEMPTATLPEITTEPEPETLAVPTNDPNSGFKLSRTTAYYTVGQSEYAAIVQEYPAGSGEANEVWTSSNPKIATVNNLGMVTAVAPGECYITVSTSLDPNKEAVVKVVVTDGGGVGVQAPAQQ